MLVAPGQARPGPGDQLLRELQPRFGTTGIMLISRTGRLWAGVEAYAHFNHAKFLHQVMMKPRVRWKALPELAVEEVPF